MFAEDLMICSESEEQAEETGDMQVCSGKEWNEGQ